MVASSLGRTLQRGYHVGTANTGGYRFGYQIDVIQHHQAVPAVTIGPNLGDSGHRVRFAMAKVEGSNPFIRFNESPGDPGLSCALGRSGAR